AQILLQPHANLLVLGVDLGHGQAGAPEGTGKGEERTVLLAVGPERANDRRPFVSDQAEVPPGGPVGRKVADVVGSSPKALLVELNEAFLHAGAPPVRAQGYVDKLVRS